MKIHKPHLWFLYLKLNSCKSSLWNCHCIPLSRINKVTICLVLVNILGSKSLENNEVVTMNLNWMVFNKQEKKNQHAVVESPNLATQVHAKSIFFYSHYCFSIQALEYKERNAIIEKPWKGIDFKL